MVVGRAETAESHPLTALEDTYEVQGPLSVGGMGRLLLVRHRMLGEVRVAKILRARLGQDKKARARFLREAEVAGRLRHPNLVKVHHSYLGEDGSAIIVMERVSGPSLADALRRQGALPVDLAVEVGVQTLRGLGYLHRKGLVHRDVSPDNLMLGRDRAGDLEVKLIDLGIVKVLAAETLTGTGDYLGTLSYSSPEQISAQKDRLGPASDLYSLGLVLYEALAGVHPCPQETVAELIACQLLGSPPDLAGTRAPGEIPAALRDAVHRALEKSPEDRFESAEEFRMALESAARGTALEAGWEKTLPAIDLALAHDEGGVAPRGPGTTSSLVASLVAEARRRAARGELWTAVELLQDALDHDPESQMAGELLRETLAEHRRVRRLTAR